MSKYKARRVECPTHGKFDSLGEYNRWCFLVLMQKAGEITELHRQVPFKLEVSGVKICKLILDFEYRLKDGTWICEDFKGIITPAAKLKIKLFEAIHGKKIYIAKTPKQWHN